MPGRFYFFDLDTKAELKSHPLNGSVLEGTGAHVLHTDKRLPAREEIFVANDRNAPRQRVTTDDFDGKAVGVKLWYPADAEAQTEKFFLIPHIESFQEYQARIAACDHDYVPSTDLAPGSRCTRCGRRRSRTEEVLEAVPAEHRSAVSSYVTLTMNTQPGWRPSDAAHAAVARYERLGYEAFVAAQQMESHSWTQSCADSGCADCQRSLESAAARAVAV